MKNQSLVLQTLADIRNELRQIKSLIIKTQLTPTFSLDYNYLNLPNHLQKILIIVRHSNGCDAGTIAKTLKKGRANISHHCKILENMGLLTYKMDGKRKMYMVNGGE